jgi:hypothetical protein
VWKEISFLWSLLKGLSDLQKDLPDSKWEGTEAYVGVLICLDIIEALEISHYFQGDIIGCHIVRQVMIFQLYEIFLHFNEKGNMAEKNYENGVAAYEVGPVTDI